METLTLLQRAREMLASPASTEQVSTRVLATAIAAQYGGDPSTIAQGLARLGKAGCPLVWRKEPFTQAKGPRKGQPATHYFWRYSSLEWSPPSTARPSVVAELQQPLANEIARLANVAQSFELRLHALEQTVANLLQAAKGDREDAQLDYTAHHQRIAALEGKPAALDDAAVATLQRIADIMRTQGWEI